MTRSSAAEAAFAGGPFSTAPLIRTLATSRSTSARDMAHARKCLVLLEMEAGVRRDFAVTALQSGGTTVIATVTGQPLDNLDAVFASHVVVLDGSARAYDSLEICRRLAALDGPPVLLLAGSDQEDERIAGLESGADDCVSACASARELLARVLALVRRRPRHPTSGSAPVGEEARRLTFAGWSFCLTSGELRGPTGRTEFLSRADHVLLAAFVERPRQILSQDQLAEITDALSNGAAGVDWRVRISRLRARLDRLGGGGSLIQTTHRKGYVFVADCLWGPTQGSP